jgi:hypothetical protein
MGLADRDYMQAGRTVRRRPEPFRAPWHLRVRFWLWNLFRVFRSGSSR